MAESDDFLEDFNRYAGTLKTWLVAYGVGGPLLFLTEQKSLQSVIDSGYARFIVLLFLVGVFAQVVSAFVGKWLSWVEYCRADGSKRYRTLAKISKRWVDWVWPEATLDAISVISFIVATLWIVIVLTQRCS